jgi:hypothetical protein
MSDREASSAGVTAEQPLAGVLVGLSISESPDLGRLGLAPTDLEEAFYRIARHLLASGASLAYGGDHRRQGFTERLLDLARTHGPPDQPPRDRIRSYLAWPLYLKLTASERAGLNEVARLEEVPPPPDLVADPGKWLDPEAGVESRYVWARSLTAMRERMNADLGARVLLGGRVTGYLGRYPGLVEEALSALRSGKPLYLLGGFGGCTSAVIRALGGETPAELTSELQFASDPYRELVAYCNSRSGEPPIDYQAVCREFGESGVAGLHNGLTAAENERLFVTGDPDELIDLLLKGLTSVAPAV